MSSFTGLNEGLFLFLEDLKLNNNRSWFNKNKQRYLDEVVQPVAELIICVGGFLPQISSSFVADPKANGGSMFRIYRDIRFSKDKTPYKTHVGCQFRHIAGRGAHAPGFYIHIEPNTLFVGGGIWLPPSDVLFNIRTAIARHPDKWKKAAHGETLQKVFPQGVAGVKLKRPPSGFSADLPFIEDIKKKSFFVMTKIEKNKAKSESFMGAIKGTFTSASPVIEFICKALDLPF